MSHFFLSYFAGCGGSSLGAKNAGCDTLGVEIHPAISELYQANVSDIIVADVAQLNPSTLDFPSPDERKRSGNLLIWQLSPPCQDYSQAHKNGNKSSQRALVLNEIFWHEEIIKPDVIILENVLGYLTSEPFVSFCKYLSNKGYIIATYKLNSKEFGVPQSRDRLIMIGVANQYQMPLIQKTHAEYPDDGQLTLFDEIGKKPCIGWYDATYDLLPSLKEVQLTDKQKEALQRELQGYNLNLGLFRTQFLERNGKLVTEPSRPSPTVTTMPHALRPFLIERVGYHGLPKVASADKPCWTIRACLADDKKGKKTGKKSGTRTKLIDAVIPSEEMTITAYSLSTQALARLQTFPDSYQWSGKGAIDVEGIGNAVPVLMMEKIVSDVLKGIHLK